MDANLLEIAGGRHIHGRNENSDLIAGLLNGTAATKGDGPKRVPQPADEAAALEQISKAQASDNPFRTLVLDGGGIHGLAQVKALAELERRTGKPIFEQFDLMVGTSTGGLISLALATPHPDDPNRSLMSAQELVEFYENEGPKIFGTRNRTESGVDWDEKPLEDFLKSKFGDMRMSDVRIPVMVSAYDADRGEAVWLRDLGPAYCQHCDSDPLLWQAARATSAAPTKFRPVEVDMGEGQEPRTRNLIDGGVFANMPALEAYVVAQGMAQDIGGGRPVEMLSIGTGVERVTMSAEKVTKTGALGWAINFFDRFSPIREVAEQGKESSADVLLSSKLGERYHRWDIPLKHSEGKKFSPSGKIDDASAGNLEKLSMVADDFIYNNWDQVERMADRLSPGREPATRPAKQTQQELRDRLNAADPKSPGLLARFFGWGSKKSTLLASGPDAQQPKVHSDLLSTTSPKALEAVMAQVKGEGEPPLAPPAKNAMA
ncbi:MAG: patatin-like phospholipase family protein [Alphaproteobacteria bacterium]|nr:patatin-like phospholipase family protein [Alphaproteobacteria bacterium SS10]